MYHRLVRKHSYRRPRPGRRRGFTLVELLVAVVLIDIGVLALVAESAVLVRKRNELTARAVAARLASDRVQTLAAFRCTPAAGAQTDPPGVRETWSVSPVSNRVREVRDSVAFDAGGTTHAVVLRTRLSC